MPDNEINYTTLQPGDQLAILRDTLRGREADHYRLSVLSDEAEPTRASRLPVMAAEIKRLQKLVAEVEKEHGQARPTSAGKLGPDPTPPNPEAKSNGATKKPKP